MSAPAGAVETIHPPPPVERSSPVRPVHGNQNWKHKPCPIIKPPAFALLTPLLFAAVLLKKPDGVGGAIIYHSGTWP